MLILITVASLLLALVMTLVAWRTVRAERERSAARVEALARDIHQSSVMDELPLRAPEREQNADNMFGAAVESTASGSRWGLALAVGGFAIASIAAMVIVFGGDTPAARIAMASATEQAQAARLPAAAVPLELVALSHDRDGNQLTVRGIVRNPANGTEMDRLSAVVVLLNQEGETMATMRTPVAASALIPGGQSTFSTTVPNAADVARYRVSFRSDERVVAHVDKRTSGS